MSRVGFDAVELNEAFHAQMPTFYDAKAVNRRVTAHIVDGERDVEEYVVARAKIYLVKARRDFPGAHLLFDFHVGNPALLGVSFAYNHLTDELSSWTWTECPRLVDAMTVTDARRQVSLFREAISQVPA